MQEVSAGLALTPMEQVVTVTNTPVLGITFSQFRATVAGTVKCIGKLLPAKQRLWLMLGREGVDQPRWGGAKNPMGEILSSLDREGIQGRQ